MFAWIGRMYDSVTGRIDNLVRSWVRDVINGVYGFFHSVFIAVSQSWQYIVDVTHYWAINLESLAKAVWTRLYHLYRVVIPAVINEYRTLVHAANRFINSVLVQALRWFSAAIQYAATLVSDVRNWVMREVWTPLTRGLLAAWHWITHEGATVLGYIRHPDKLADLIWDALLAKLEREAWTAGELLGRFFLSLILRNLKRFAHLLEDILDAVL